MHEAWSGKMQLLFFPLSRWGTTPPDPSRLISSVPQKQHEKRCKIWRIVKLKISNFKKFEFLFTDPRMHSLVFGKIRHFLFSSSEVIKDENGDSCSSNTLNPLETTVSSSPFSSPKGFSYLNEFGEMQLQRHCSFFCQSQGLESYALAVIGSLLISLQTHQEQENQWEMDQHSFKAFKATLWKKLSIAHKRSSPKVTWVGWRKP